ncbi:MAG: response regulator [Burkholderiales bacterium]|nr:response regulator [Burkholderiales bacterium]
MAIRPADPASGTARLQRWIVGVGAGALIALAASSIYDAVRTYRYAIADTERELANLGGTLAEQLEGSLQPVDVLLQSTSDSLGRLPDGAPEAAVDRTLAIRAAELPQVTALDVFDAQGRSKYSSAGANAGPAYVGDRAYFTVHRDDPTARLFVSEQTSTRPNGRRELVLSRALRDPYGKFAGIVAATVELAELRQSYRAIDLGSRSAVSLYRSDGTLLVREPSAPGTVGKVVPAIAAFADAAPGRAPARLEDPLDGRSLFIAARRLDPMPLIVAVARDSAAVLQPWRREMYHVAGRTLAMLALGALAIAALVRQLRRIDAGQRALRESETRYALAMEVANEGHWDWLLDGTPSYVSPTMKRLHGRAPDTRATTREEWLAQVDVHADDRARVEAAVAAQLAGGSVRYEVEYRVRDRDGAWRWLNERGSCLRNAAGEPWRFVGSTIDVTPRKEAERERERVTAQLRQSQRLEAVGTLAGGIAHDFNNILGAVVGYGELAQTAAPPGSALRRYADNIMHAADRGRALVERVLVFSRSGMGERIAVDVQAVVAEALELLAASLPARLRLESRLDAGHAAVLGDDTQLHQVVMNLCLNAIQAMGDEGLLEVALTRTTLARPQALSHGLLGAGSYVRLMVRDSGPGIAPDVQERMFDPFFTTKGVGQGTGLGLSLVHGVVADLAGAIDVQTRPGGGSAFTVVLPVIAEAAPAEQRDNDATPHGKGQTVMIVDDEPALVALAEEMLADLGYEPVGFTAGAAALAALRDAPQRFDAILTDETMPRMSGSELARAIHALRPDLAILLMSGYRAPQLGHGAFNAGVREVLAKPLRQRDIARALARALELDRTNC